MSKMADLGLNFKVSKHWKNDCRTTFKSFNAKKGLNIKKEQTFGKLVEMLKVQSGLLKDFQ